MRRSYISSFDTLALSRKGYGAVGLLLVCVLLLAAAVEGLLRLDDTPKGLPFESTRTGTMVDQLRKTGKGFDYFFVGSSMCATDVSPADFIEEMETLTGRAVSAYNGGVNGARVLDTEVIYDVLWSKVPIGNLVFIVSPGACHALIHPEIVESYGMLHEKGSLTRFDNALMRLHLFKYRRQYREFRYQFYLLRTRSLEADLSRRIGPNRLGWLPMQGGFIAVSDVTTVEARRNPIWDGWRVQDEVVQSLKLTINRARKNGAKSVIVAAPQPERFSETMTDPDSIWRSFLDAMAGAARETGSTFVDLHSLSEFGSEAFFDLAHLKNDDARRFSRLLARKLAGP